MTTREFFSDLAIIAFVSALLALLFLSGCTVNLGVYNPIDEVERSLAKARRGGGVPARPVVLVPYGPGADILFAHLQQGCGLAPISERQMRRAPGLHYVEMRVFDGERDDWGYDDMWVYRKKVVEVQLFFARPRDSVFLKAGAGEGYYPVGRRDDAPRDLRGRFVQRGYQDEREAVRAATDHAMRGLCATHLPKRYSDAPPDSICQPTTCYETRQTIGIAPVIIGNPNGVQSGGAPLLETGQEIDACGKISAVGQGCEDRHRHHGGWHRGGRGGKKGR